MSGVQAVLPAAFEPLALLTTDASGFSSPSSVSLPSTTEPAFEAAFPPNDTDSTAAAATANGPAGVALSKSESKVRAALLPLLARLPPVCPPAGRPDALPALLLMAVRVLGAVSDEPLAIDRRVGSAQSGEEASRSLAISAAPGRASAIAFTSAVEFVRSCVREVWAHGDASRNAGGSAGVSASGDEFVGEEAAVGAGDRVQNGNVAQAGGSGTVNAGEQKAHSLVDPDDHEGRKDREEVDGEDDDDWGDDDFQGADDIIDTSQSSSPEKDDGLSGNEDSASSAVEGTETQTSANKERTAPNTEADQDNVEEDGIVARDTGEMGEPSSSTAAAEADAETGEQIGDVEVVHTQAQGADGSEVVPQEPDATEHVDAVEVGGDEASVDEPQTPNEFPPSRDAAGGEASADVKDGEVPADIAGQTSDVVLPATDVADLPVGPAAGGEDDDVTAIPGATEESAEASAARSEAQSEDSGGSAVSAVDRGMDTTPSSAQNSPNGKDKRSISSSDNVSPLAVPNALDLIVSAGRAISDLLEKLLVQGGARNCKGSAAAIGAAAEAWGAVALILPQEAEGLAGPLRTGLTCPLDRCSVAVRLALLHAVAVSVRRADVGDSPEGAGGGEVHVEREAAVLLLRLLAPYALAAVKLEVHRAGTAPVRGRRHSGGSGVGGEQEQQEACLLEGVTIAQMAFKVRL